MNSDVLNEAFPVSATTIQEAQDAAGYEVYAALHRENKLWKWNLSLFGLLICGLSARIYYLEHQKPIIQVIRIDEAGRAAAIAYSNFDYTPRDGEIRRDLLDWARYRYTQLRTSADKTYPLNYYFVGDNIAPALMEEDRKSQSLAKLIAGQGEENDLIVDNIQMTSLSSRKAEDGTLATGSATIDMHKVFPASTTGQERREHWTVSVSFYLNPEQVAERAQKDPKFEEVNPLGLIITYLHPDRAYN